MADKQKPHTYERREFMTKAGTGVVALAAVGLFAGKAQADAAGLAKAVMAKIGKKEQKSGRIKIELPQIAENGNTVPVGFEVESPMSGDDYVKAVHLFADENPVADVATFRFTPESGKAQVSTRMRLAKSQNVIAVAEMSDGSVYSAKKAVKVTIGGCGG